MRTEKIGPEHARALGRLEAEIYPPGFCLGWRDFKEDLEDAETDGSNFSFGLFEESEMVGYLVAYGDGCQIYISDIAILPYNRAGDSAAQLVAVFLQSAREAGLPFYAECRMTAWKFIQGHLRLFRQYGFTLADRQLLPGYNNGEDHWKVVFEPRSIDAGAA